MIELRFIIGRCGHGLKLKRHLFKPALANPSLQPLEREGRTVFPCRARKPHRSANHNGGAQIAELVERGRAQLPNDNGDKVFQPVHTVKQLGLLKQAAA